jgi:hypothetical protein
MSSLIVKRETLLDVMDGGREVSAVRGGGPSTMVRLQQQAVVSQ